MITVIAFFYSRGCSHERRISFQTVHAHEAKIAARAAIKALFADANFTQLLVQ